MLELEALSRDLLGLFEECDFQNDALSLKELSLQKTSQKLL